MLLEEAFVCLQDNFVGYKETKMKNMVVLVLVCILLSACLISLLLCRRKRETYNQTIAVYGANFGGYRDEISSKILSDCVRDRTVDYFFYTDQELNCPGWKIRHPNKVPGDHIMDSNRWTSKATKWIVPDELRSYDIIVWVDSKLFPMREYSRSTILNMLSTYPDKDLIMLEHPYGRRTSIGEMHETVSRGFENRSDKVEDFYNILSDFVDPVPLADTCQLIMKGSPSLFRMLETVYDTLERFELKRDQCVFNYALVESGYPVTKVQVTPDMPILRPVANANTGVFQKNRDAEKKVIEDIASEKCKTNF